MRRAVAHGPTGTRKTVAPNAQTMAFYLPLVLWMWMSVLLTPTCVALESAITRSAHTYARVIPGSAFRAAAVSVSGWLWWLCSEDLEFFFSYASLFHTTSSSTILTSLLTRRKKPQLNTNTKTTTQTQQHQQQQHQQHQHNNTNTTTPTTPTQQHQQHRQHQQQQHNNTTELDACSFNETRAQPVTPCGSNGQCKNGKNKNKPGGFKCDCLPGYTGFLCDISEDTP